MLRTHSAAATSPGPLRPQWLANGAEHRADRDAGVRRRGEPAEPLGAILRLERVGDVRLNHAHRAAARALHEARQEEQPERVRDTRRRRTRSPTR